jgi:regulator of protease activity HflC (stomatin/prohibitin superfamily)
MDTAIIVAFGVLLLALLSTRRCTIYEYERGLLYRTGRFRRILGPGRHWLVRTVHTVSRVDVRTQFVTIASQEVLSADNVGIKISLAAEYRVSDPARAVIETVDFRQALYLLLQLSLRDLVGSTPIEDLLARREEIGQQLHDRTAGQAADLGLELSLVAIKDVMFPGELKSIFAQVVNARNEGLAALERARGESAALRNLANAARLVESNPALLQLRLLQAVGEGSGNTVVLASNLDELGRLGLLQDKGQE